MPAFAGMTSPIHRAVIVGLLGSDITRAGRESTAVRARGSSMGAWAMLILCIVAEVIATSLLKKSNGFAEPLYGILSIVIFAGCFWALSYVLTRIPIGVTYAVWAGTGMALVSIVGWAVFRQPLSAVQLVFMAFIVGGSVGLSLSTVPRS
jgi:small multidrug resistance pump